MTNEVAGDHVGIVARARCPALFGRPERDQLAELGRLADAGELVPAIDSTFPLERARDAFARVAARGTRGKVVLDVAGGRPERR